MFRTYPVSIEKSWLCLDVSLDAVKMYIESITETSGGHLRQDVTLDQVHQEVTLDPVRQDGTPRALQPHLLEATSGLGPFENDNQRM